MLFGKPEEDLGHGDPVGISLSLNSCLKGGFATEGDTLTTNFDGDMGEVRW